MRVVKSGARFPPSTVVGNCLGREHQQRKLSVGNFGCLVDKLVIFRIFRLITWLPRCLKPNCLVALLLGRCVVAEMLVCLARPTEFHTRAPCTCFARVLRVFHTCSTRVPHVFHTCSTVFSHVSRPYAADDYYSLLYIL